MLDLRVKKIIADIAQARGEQFFSQISQSLADAINADITFIATLRDQQAVTVAAIIDGQSSKNFSYAVKDTPCEQVSTGRVCCYDSNVQQLFPNDDLLKEMGVNSYIGVPLHDGEGGVIGILVSLFRDGLGDQETIEALFLLFSGLISSELGRRDYLRDYKLAAAVIDNVNEAVIITDHNSYITYVNPAFETISGYSAKEAVGKKSDLIRSNQHTQLFHEEMKLKIAANQSWSGEIFNKRKNGEIYPERISVNAIRDEKNILRHYVCFFSDISERKKTEDELNFQSHYDSLTQLPNMEQFIHIVNENIGRPQSKKFAVAIIDIDNFRGVNDSYGHAFGNRFLKKVSQRLSHAKRSQDTLSRFGGDQFPLLINNIEGPHQASKIISEIQQQLKAPFFINNQEINITSRVGVSIYPNDSDCAEQLVSNANQSLVYAEQGHDNRYSFFAPSMRQDSERRMYLKSAMIKSIIQQSFKLAFQPIIDTEKQRVSKFEVLLRW